MAFPGTYNISYYKGDTLEFTIYPKTATGGAFPLSGYGNVKFTISTSRGSGGVSNQIQAYSVIVDDYILCVIRPADGLQLAAGTTYVYDIEMSKSGVTYPSTITLLTGTISVTDHISGAI